MSQDVSPKSRKTILFCDPACFIGHRQVPSKLWQSQWGWGAASDGTVGPGHPFGSRDCLRQVLLGRGDRLVDPRLAAACRIMCASAGQLTAVPEESLTQLGVSALPREPEVTVSPRSRTNLSETA